MSEQQLIPNDKPDVGSQNSEVGDQKTRPVVGDQQPTTHDQTSNLKSETPNMETHAHHLHKAPGHGWKHYLFEFLMLFIAVFCGFLAENWREHILEGKREKQYIKSFYEDLSADERDLQLNINFLRRQMTQADSLQKLMTGITTNQPANLVYMYLRGITRSAGGMVHANDRTIVQLRNAGGMRLIKNKSASDSMVGYYRTIETIQFLIDDGIINKRLLREKYMPLLNADDFAKVIDSSNQVINIPGVLFLRNSNPDIINDCLIEIDRIKTLNLALANAIQRLKEKAGRIKAFIKNEYHLQDE
jgi:hypothetical protein